MSLLGDVGGAALGGVGLGLPLAHFWSELTKDGSSGPGPAPRKPVTAKDIAVPQDELNDIFQGIGAQGTKGINDIYGAQRARAASDARGMRPGVGAAPPGYADERFAARQGLDTGSLEASLGGALGGTGYQDWKQQRDYEQSRALAESTADAMKPSLLQQVLSGIGTAGRAGGQFYAMGGGRKKKPTTFNYPLIGNDSSGQDPYYDIG